MNLIILTIISCFILSCVGDNEQLCRDLNQAIRSHRKDVKFSEAASKLASKYCSGSENVNLEGVCQDSFKTLQKMLSDNTCDKAVKRAVHVCRFRCCCRKKFH
jgi:hypothetical protein